MIRTFWFTVGVFSIALGGLGVFLPLLPTVPFLLLSAYGFARSSERLHSWLLAHPFFGHHIAAWRDRGAIGPRAKRIATVSILAAFGISAALGLNPWVLAAQGIALAAVGVFIWTRPSA